MVRYSNKKRLFFVRISISGPINISNFGAQMVLCASNLITGPGLNGKRLLYIIFNKPPFFKCKRIANFLTRFVAYQSLCAVFRCRFTLAEINSGVKSFLDHAAIRRLRIEILVIVVIE